MPTIKINSLTIQLPYQPYPAQVATISKMLTAFQENSSALIESPTGTGKSLAILCSVLAYKQSLKEDIKVYICSRTHKQIDQMIEQLRKTTYRPKICILASRAQLCINSLVIKEGDKIKACRDLIKKNSCGFFNKKEDLAQRIRSNIFDSEELKKEGRNCKACPFYASRIVEETADIVFAPYNYVIDPAIRKAMNINLKNSIVIIDEAHNIEDFCRGAGSLNFESDTIDIIANEILKSIKSGFQEEQLKMEMFFLLEILRKFKELNEKEELHKKARISLSDQNTQENKRASNWKSINEKERRGSDSTSACMKLKSGQVVKGQQIIEILEGISITREKIMRFKNIIYTFNKNEELKEVLSMTSLQVLESLCFTLEILFYKNPDCYAFAMKKKLMGEFTLNFWLLDPSVIFVPLVSEVKSIILLSGTLSPFKSFNSELGHNFKHMVEAPHVINKDNVFIGCIERGHLGKELIGKYGSSEMFEYLDQLKAIILTLREKVKTKGGTLVFVPSYSFLNNLYKRMEKEKNVYAEPQNGLKFTAIFNKYRRNIEHKEGPILICVYRGRASEGMDFKDSYARAVIAVGIPFPSFMDLEVVSKREYNDKHKEMKGMAWYEIQAFRAVNQAIGRVIRHKEDWGGVFLVDSRYKQSRNVEMLPRWVKENFNVYNKSEDCISKFVNFLKNKA